MLVLDFGRKDRIDHLAFSPDGRAVVASSEYVVRYWPEIRAGAHSVWVNSPFRSRRAVFADGGKALLFSTSRLWRADLTTARVIPLTVENIYTRYHVSPDARFVLVEEHDTGATPTTTLALHPATDLTAGGRLWARVAPGNHYSRAHFVADGARIVRHEGEWNGGRSEQHVVTYDAATGEPVARSPVVRDLVHATEAAPDGRWMVGLRDAWLYYWPVTAECGAAGYFRNDSPKHFTDAAFHPSSRFLALTSNDKTVKLYDTTTWEVARTFTWDVGKMRSICFSPDGTLAAAGTDKGQVVVWDVDL